MEGREGGAKTLPQNKSSTLPGYRVGPVRYGVRLAPPDAHDHSPSPLRRSSEGDAGNRGNHSCDRAEEDEVFDHVKRRFLSPFDEEEEEEEIRDVEKLHRRLSPAPTNVANRTNSTPSPTTTIATNPSESVTPYGPSPPALKEAHSLLNHKRALVTVPSLGPHALPPLSPRPHSSSRRRSFNASPRPWVAPGGNYSPTTTTTTAPPTRSEDVNDTDNDDKRWHMAPIDGVRCTSTTTTTSTTTSSKLKIGSSLNRSNGSSPSPSSSKGRELHPVPVPLPPPRPDDTPGDIATFRSEATILVSRGDEGQRRRREKNYGVRSPISRRRGVGILSLAKNISSVNEQREGVGGDQEEEEEEDSVGGGRSQVAVGATATASRGVALVEEVKVGCLPPPTSKYTCCVAGRSPRQLLPRHATMFSYPGPSRPAIPEEPDSAHFTSDQCSAALFFETPSHAHGTTTGGTTVLSGRSSESIASGGSGHGDRVAPPAPVTTSAFVSRPSSSHISTTLSTTTVTTTSAALSTAPTFTASLSQPSSAATTPTATTPTGEERKTKRQVRPKPEIPDHLYRRWAVLLPPPHGEGAPAADQQPKQKQENSSASSNKGAHRGIHSLADEGPLTPPLNFDPPSGGNRRFSSDLLDLQSDLLQNFARYRLGINTGDMGGGRREGGRGPPPSRPPRSRQDNLEKLRKCTERLKTPSPDKKARGGDASPSSSSDATAAAASGSGDTASSRSHKSKKRSSDPRGVLHRHPSLGKSPSLPTQLPSCQDEAAKRLSPLPLKENNEAPLPGNRREDEDIFNESTAKLPPLPRPEPRLVIPPRVIPFRSASVSQVDVRSDGSFSVRSSKSPIHTRLYPFCKDYRGSNTLPRCKPTINAPEGEGTEGGASPQRSHPPLIAAASISDMTNVGGKGGSPQPEKLENKSKSESELSVTTHNNSDGGSPKVDLLEIRDSFLSKKTDSKEERERKSPKVEDGKEGKSKNEDKNNKNDNETDKNQSELEKVNNEKNTKDKESNNKQNVSENKDIVKSGETNSEKDVNNTEYQMKNENVELLPENYKQDASQTKDVLSEEKQLLSLNSDCQEVPGELNNDIRDDNNTEHNKRLAEREPQNYDDRQEANAESEVQREKPKISVENKESVKFYLPGDDPVRNINSECVSDNNSDSNQIREELKQIVKGEMGIVPPGGEMTTPGGQAPSGETPRPSRLSQERSVFMKELCAGEQQENPSTDNYPLSIKDKDDNLSNNTENMTSKSQGGGGESTVVDGEGNKLLCPDRRQIECQVLQKEPRLSQCLVIKSGAGAGESGELDPMGGQEATSECRVVRSRPRLPREDSDEVSADRESSQGRYVTQTSDEGIFEEEVKSPEPRDSSDSSSQDSVGLSQDRPCGEMLSPSPANLEDVPVRQGSRRRRKLTEEGNERSLTFPPPPRKNSQADSIGYSSVDSNGLRSLATSGGYGDRGSSEEQRSSFSLADSYISDGSQPSDTRQLLLISEGRPPPMDRAERKKKHHSDPSCERRGSTDALLYFSEPHLESPVVEGNNERTSSKGVVSQASTDSEGRDDRLEHQQMGPHRICTPQVMLSGHESDGSDYPPSRTPLRNSSPIPYFPDSDSGDKSAPRSPHGPRRYSKRPLRGPYGEMLEAEMSKSKTSSPYLYEDTYLRVREAKSCSPRPPSPVSPSVMMEGNERPPLAMSGPRSLDDSALTINYSNTPDRSGRRKTSGDTDPGATSPVGPAWESDGEGTLSPLAMGPMHQRTASSPSKLFSEGGFTSEEEQELVDYYSAAERKLAKQSQQQRQQQHRQQQPQQPQQQQQQQEQQQQPPPPTQQMEEMEATVTEIRQPPTSHEHRHSHKRHRDTRAHVVGELYDTERNYVNNLNFLLKRYQETLKSPEYSAIIDGSLVDDIFFQVPEIHSQHERFIEELKQRLESRDASLCVGDVFLQLVNDPGFVESYIAFTNNWKTAQEAAKAAAQAKPAFRHFLVARAREHSGKLDLKALLIKPVQRVPQYELILKRLLKHTSRDNPDYNLITEAIGVVQQIAGRINAVEQETLQHEQQLLLLKELENIIEGLEELVQPDRTFVRHDFVTMHFGLGTRKERCLFLFSDLLVITAIKRRTGTTRKGSSLPFTLLSSLESNKFKLFKFIPLDDLDIARSRDESMKKLVREVETLDEDRLTLQNINKLIKGLHCPKAPLEETLNEMISSNQKQLEERHGADSRLMELELTITTQEGMENLTFMFSSADKRALWEEAFNDAKQKLAMSADRRPPPEFVSALPIRKTRAGLQFTCATATLGLNAHNLKDVWVCNSDGYVGQVCVLSLQPDPTVACCNGVCNARILSIASIPAAPQPDSSDDEDDEDIPMEEDIRKRRSESLPPEMGSDDSENQQPTMWLGTEDGFIHVYNCSDTIRIKKNKFKFQPGSPVHCIIHLDNRVFASLANGDIIVYRRDISGGWNVADRQVVSISTAAAPVTRMMAVAGKLWCAAMNTIRVLNTTLLQVEHSFVVGGENGKGVSCMVSAGHGVWISVHNSAAVRLYHAITYECLCEVNVAPAVTKMLAGCDDIIRQHKAACLRVTSLLACKDLLWVGTSAGVIITVPLPHLAHNTHRVQAPLNMVGIPYGHTGHVRFLTSVELTPESRPSRLKGHSRYSFKGKDHPHHQPGTAAPAKLLVISGGDGYEDFRSSGMSELAGRDDSTNHLLLWQV